MLPTRLLRRLGTRPRSTPAVAAAVVVLAVTASSGALTDGDPAGAADHVSARHGGALPTPLQQILGPTTTMPSTSLPAPTAPAPAATTAPVAPPPAAVTSSASASSLAANGIPTAALRAYRRSATLADKSDPGCHIVWPLVAAIGRVESDHGRFADNVLHADGVSTPGIVGIPLNGHGTEVVRDTDHGTLDGDRTYDRAVGPMQFIPSTWAHWRTDADRDGKSDINDIDDAAAATAAYLCADGRNLATYAGQRSAVLSYNHSTAYLRTVLDLEKAYARGVVTVPTAPGHGHAHPPKAATPKPSAPPSPASAPAKPKPSSSKPKPTKTTSPTSPTKTTSPPPTTTSPSCPTSTPTSASSATPSTSPSPTSCTTSTSAPGSATPSATPTSP